MDLLHEILQPGRKTAIVDVGAAALDGPRPYELLLEHGLCTVVGFDPQAELWPQSRPGVPRFGLETYLPHIIGDGSARTLRVCASPGMTSLYEPDEAVFDLFPGMREWCKIVREEKVATRRLDDLDAVREIVGEFHEVGHERVGMAEEQCRIRELAAYLQSRFGFTVTYAYGVAPLGHFRAVRG